MSSEEIEGNDSADREFYSRQVYVLGKEAMQRMQSSQVVIVGLGGLGQEIAKNTILSGVKTVYLCDDGVVGFDDLASSFFFSESEVGKNRVESCITDLRALNTFVKVLPIKRADLTKEFLNEINCICFTDEPIMSLVEMNKLCRATHEGKEKGETKCRFVACETRGLFGAIFCDMGDEFLVFDPNGEAPVTNTVVHVTNEKEATVTILDEDISNHGMGRGDKVLFSNVEGMTQLNEMGPVEFIEEGRYTFRIKVDTTDFPPYKLGSGYCKQVKATRVMKSKPLAESIESPNVLMYDFGKWGYGEERCHPMWRASYDFLKAENRYPKPYNEDDAKKLIEMVKKYNPGCSQFEEFIRLFSYTCRGKLNPLAALIGGFAGQEVQKAVSGKFTPLDQWFYIDALECLNPKSLPKEDDCQPRNCRYDGTIQVFGNRFQELLLKQKIFLVGAGALGCEYLKNFAMLGVGASQEGAVHVTDMDIVEESNLNRQFLFRHKHLGKMKSTSAAETAKVMNPNLNITAKTEKVGPDTEDVFDEVFWDGLDCVVTALDNILARLYIDGECVNFQKPLIEGGTLGALGNVQVVVPQVTEHYGAQVDPEEKGFQSCTVKTFPYRIEHTIAWAKLRFAEFFTDEPKNVKSYLENPEGFYMDLKKVTNSPVHRIMTSIHRNLLTERPRNLEDCVDWARKKFEKDFVKEILTLLGYYPPDRMTKGGLPFWSGAKRLPSILDFETPKSEEEKKTMCEFIKSAALIRAEVYSIEAPKDFDWEEAFKKITISQEIIIKKKDDEEDEDEGEWVDPEKKEIEDCVKELRERKNEFEGLEVQSIPFEKDDDSNHHVEFMTSASNCRAINYRIPPVDQMKTRGIAGNIIPAMVTTTSSVTGFGMIEFLKYITGKRDLESYKNVYINLSLPLCTMSYPNAAKIEDKNEFFAKSPDEDYCVLDLGKDVTIGDFCKSFEEKMGLRVGEITMLFASCSFYRSGVSTEDVLEKKTAELCWEVSKVQPPEDSDWVQFFVVLEPILDKLDKELALEIGDSATWLVKYKFRGWKEEEEGEGEEEEKKE